MSWTKDTAIKIRFILPNIYKVSKHACLKHWKKTEKVIKISHG